MPNLFCRQQASSLAVLTPLLLSPLAICRQHLLLLFEALVGPSILARTSSSSSADSNSSAGGGASEAAVRAAHANGVALVEARGVQLMVDVLAGE